LLLVAAAALAALPAVGLAQSAGDQQYENPIPGGDNPTPSTPSTPSTPATPSGTTPSSTPSQSSAAGQSSGTSSGRAHLARTGFDALIPAVLGALLIAAGAAMLLVPRRRARRN
jgi:hypothetical protein